MNAELFTTPFSTTAALSQAEQLPNAEEKSMKRSFYILFGGIGTGWLTCMVILASYIK